MLMGAVIGLLLINLSLVAFLVLRKPPVPPHDRQAGGNGPKRLVIEKLHFSPDQTAQYEQLIEEHRTQIDPLNEHIKAAKNRLYITLATNDAARKDSLINQIGSLQRQIEVVHYNHFVALKKLCRPDQLADFNELTTDLAGFFAPRRKPPGGP